MTANQFKQWKDTEPMSKYAFEKILTALARGDSSVNLSIEKTTAYDENLILENFTVTKFKNVYIVHL